MKKLKEHPVLLVSSIVCLIIGLWLLTTNPDYVLKSIYVMVGGCLIMAGISKILSNKDSEEKSFMYDGIINILIGVIIMFVHDFIVTTILGVLFVAFPVFRICKSFAKKEQFKRELPLLLIGLVIVLSGDLIGKLFVKLLGVILIGVAIYLFVGIFAGYIKFINIGSMQKKTQKKIRDNVIDAEYEEGNNE